MYRKWCIKATHYLKHFFGMVLLRYKCLQISTVRRCFVVSHFNINWMHPFSRSSAASFVVFVQIPILEYTINFGFKSNSLLHQYRFIKAGLDLHGESYSRIRASSHNRDHNNWRPIEAFNTSWSPECASEEIANARRICTPWVFTFWLLLKIRVEATTGVSHWNKCSVERPRFWLYGESFALLHFLELTGGS